MPKPKGFPSAVNIYGKRYSVEYVTEMTKADIDGRDALWGQVDYMTRSIRVYLGKDKDKKQPIEVLDTLVHEIIHAVLKDNHALDRCVSNENHEAFVSSFATCLIDTLVRNKILKLEGGE